VPLEQMPEAQDRRPFRHRIIQQHDPSETARRLCWRGCTNN
jgi:hypothetical protein